MSNAGFFAGAILALLVVVFAGGSLFYFSILQTTPTQGGSGDETLLPQDAPPSYFTKDRQPLVGFPVTDTLQELKLGEVVGDPEKGTIQVLEFVEQSDTSFESEKWSALVRRTIGSSSALDQALSFGDQQKRVYAHQVLTIGSDYWFVHAITQDSLLLAKFANPDEARSYPLVWQE